MDNILNNFRNMYLNASQDEIYQDTLNMLNQLHQYEELKKDPKKLE